MKTTLWKFTLRVLRDLLWKADEWIHREEAKLQEAGMRRRELAAVDRRASRIRERAIKISRAGSIPAPGSSEARVPGHASPAPEAGTRTAAMPASALPSPQRPGGRGELRTPRRPRLHYRGGQFVRQS